MADPTSTVNGVISGIQWQTMVDQIIALESQRTVTPLTTQQTTLTNAAAAWKDFQTVVGRFRDAAKTLRDGTAFGSLTASGGTSSTTGRSLVSAAASATATPGSYSIGVEQLASAEKVGSGVFGSTSAALGIAGAFLINGRRVTITGSDTLTTVRDKINATNSGATRSGVSAAFSKSGAGTRLVLTSDATGSSGVELADVSGSALTSLGFSDGTVHANLAANGATQSFGVSSSTATFAALWGIPLPSPSTIQVGGQTISVDFSTDTLASIAAQINAATGVANAATVVQETSGSRTYSRLDITLPVSADASDAAASAATLAALGLSVGGRADVAQQLKSANAFTDDAAGGISATGGTLVTNLSANGTSLGLQSGDVVTMSGRRGDGSAVSIALTVTGATTLQNLLDAANSGVGSFGAGSRTATVSVVGGKVTVTDGTAGSSQLALSISATHSGTGTVSFGAIDSSNGTAGLSRQIVAGRDARFLVDGQSFTRRTNSANDVISGVTLNLLGAESGTTTDLLIDRNTDDITKQVQSFASAYNAVRNWANTNTADGKALAHNSSIRSMVQSLSSALLKPLTGLSGQYGTTALVGLSRDKFGVMSVDTTKLQSALESSFDDVKELFGRTGVGGSLYTAADSIARDVTGSAAVLSTASTTHAGTLDNRILAAQDRLATKKATLTKQFIAMETAMSKAQSMGSSLTSSINGLFNYNKTQ